MSTLAQTNGTAIANLEFPAVFTPGELTEAQRSPFCQW
jgi:hypothetical protein